MPHDPTELVRRRRERIEAVLGGRLDAPDAHASPLPPAAREHLVGEATDLYWNELEWERITDEEKTDGGPIPELMFPGFLAFVRGLLMREAMPDSLAPADPRPEVVEDLVAFLASRVLDHESAAGEEKAMDARVTRQLLDRVLYLLHGLSREDVARVEGQAEA